MLEIIPGLLLGSEGDAMAVLARTPSVIKQYTVTHILTISNQPLDLIGSNAVFVGSDEDQCCNDVEDGACDSVKSEASDSVEGGACDGVRVESVASDSVEGGACDGVKSKVNNTETVNVANPSKKILVKFIQLADMPESDLLHHFLSACEFIKECCNTGGTVLVHW